MKGKIIAFASVLVIAVTASIGATSAFATNYSKRCTSDSFTRSISTDKTVINAKKGSATILAKNSDYDGHYKFISIESYRYNGTGNFFTDIDDDFACGTAKTYTVVASTNNVTNIFIDGQMGYTNISNTGIEEYITLDIRKSTRYPYLNLYD